MVENFQGRKLRNFAVLEPPVKVFSTKFGHAIPTVIGLSILCKFFREKVPLTSFLLYSMSQSFLSVIIMTKNIAVVEIVICIA